MKCLPVPQIESAVRLRSLSFILSLGLAACTSLPAKESRFAELNALEKNVAKRMAVSGNLLITSELNGQSVTVPAVMIVAYPDKFRLEVQDPVGGLLALVVVNGDRFWLYERERPEILTGPLEKIPFPLLPKGNAEELVRVFLARPPMNRLRRGEVQQGRAIFREQPLVETISWDGNSEPLSWSQVVGGKPQSSAIYDDYEFRDGLRFPTKLRLDGVGADGKRRHALLIWKDWELSVPIREKLFQIPQPQAFGRKIKALR